MGGSELMIPKVGDTVELITMNDPYPIAPGEKGEVYWVNPLSNDEVQIGVNWENGRRLYLIYPFDKFKIIKKAE
jgi:hypothetical protein